MPQDHDEPPHKLWNNYASVVKAVENSHKLIERSRRVLAESRKIVARAPVAERKADSPADRTQT